MNRVIDDDLLAFMGKQESQYLIKPSNLADEIRERLNPNSDIVRGHTLPWSKTHPYVRLRENEVSLWAGINGHGKSNLIGQVCAWGLHSRWLIASMEMLPAVTVERMVKQIASTNEPSPEQLQKIINWLDQNLWLYDQTDTVDSDRILALVRYASALNIKHIVIDSLIKCGIAKKDLEAQARFVDHLCWLAKTNNLHIHLIHHIRKGESEFKLPDKFDIRGASEIIDLVDNIFIVHRNKRKEEKDPDNEEEADCYLKIAKQRHYSWEGIFNLWFNKTNGQYTAHANRSMTHWLHTQDYEMLAS